MKRTFASLAVTACIAACGGGETENPGPITPPTPSSTASTTSATPSTTASTPVDPPKPTLAEMHKKIGQAMNAAWSAHDAKKVTENYSADAVMGQPGQKGWEEMKMGDMEKRLGAFFTAAPDVKLSEVRVLVKNEVAIVEWIATGTNTGEMMGEKATGKKFGNHGISLVWLDKSSGKITRENMYMDEATFMGQLGKADKNAKFRGIEEAKGEPEMLFAKDGDDTSKNEAAVKAMYTAFEKHDDKAFGGMLADDFSFIDYTRPADVKGKAAVLKDFGEFSKAIPDVKFNVKNVWGVGDYVVAEGEMSGTLKGNLGPMKATNKSNTIHFADVVKVNKDGKLAWVETYGNGLEFAVGYGLMKPITPPAPKDAKPTDAKPTDAKKPADAKPADPKKDAPKK